VGIGFLLLDILLYGKKDFPSEREIFQEIFQILKTLQI